MIFSYFGSEWEEDGLCWKQEVSCSPSLRKDVLTVKTELDNFLVERQARDTGICQVRQHYRHLLVLLSSVSSCEGQLSPQLRAG